MRTSFFKANHEKTSKQANKGSTLCELFILCKHAKSSCYGLSDQCEDDHKRVFGDSFSSESGMTVLYEELVPLVSACSINCISVAVHYVYSFYINANDQETTMNSFPLMEDRKKKEYFRNCLFLMCRND